MELMNERTQVKETITSWLTRPVGNEDLRHVPRELASLNPETATAADITRIIGHDSWARPRPCNECGTATWDLVRLGEPEDYESYTAYICKDCLRKALKLLEGE